MKIYVSLVASLLFGSIVLPGCAEETSLTESDEGFADSNETVGATIAALGETCSMDGECSVGEICVDSICVNPPTPLPDVTCPTSLGSCTANDVVTDLLSARVIDDDDCEDGQIDLEWTVGYSTTANMRYDLAVYVAKDGGTINNSGTALECAGQAAQIGDGDFNTDADADDDTFEDNDGDTAGGVDTCGDLSTDGGPVQWTVTATVDCFTVGDLILESCRVWEQNANHMGGCTTISDAGTGSKCDCTPFDFGPVIDPCLVTDCNDGNECTADSCVSGGPGTTATCVNAPQPGDVCGDPVNGVCDAPDLCNGLGACEPTFEPDTTVCREGSGDVCDPDELCTGSSVDCPADVTSTETCRTGSGDVCDPDEVCTGNPGGRRRQGWRHNQ